ncbi:MAG: DUF3147 family protein [Candidatus Nitrotoga sp.]
MWQYALKIFLSAVVLVAVSELAKRSSFWGAALASLPLTSLLAFIWLFLDSGEVQRVSDLSHGIFWLILPSLVLFIVLPLLLRCGVGFWFSLVISCFATAVAYFGMVRLLGVFGVRI